MWNSDSFVEAETQVIHSHVSLYVPHVSIILSIELVLQSVVCVLQEEWNWKNPEPHWVTNSILRYYSPSTWHNTFFTFERATRYIIWRRICTGRENWCSHKRGKAAITRKSIWKQVCPVKSWLPNPALHNKGQKCFWLLIFSLSSIH